MRQFLRLLGLSLLAFSTACAQTNSQNRGSIAVTINPDITYQTMSGWEVTPRLWELDKRHNVYDPSWLDWRDEVVTALVDETGINRIRIEVKSGVENPVDYWTQFTSGEIGYQELRSHYYEKINDNDDPDIANPSGFQFSETDYMVENLILPMKAHLEARGERLYINLCYVDFGWTDLKGTLSHADEPREYAELIDETFKHLQEKYGLTPDSFEIILEPDNADRWWGGHIADGLVAVADRLGARNINPSYIAPSTSLANAALPYFDDLAKNEEALAHLSVFAYHRYDGQAAENAIPAIVARAESADLETAMLEYVDGGIDQLYSDLTRGNVSAWQRYGVASKARDRARAKPAYMLNLVGRAGHEELVLARGGAELAQVFRAVRSGAVRLGAEAEKNAIRPLAFRNLDGSHVIVIIADKARQIGLSGIPAGLYVVSFADSGPERDELPDIVVGDEEILSLAVPGKGVLVLQQKVLR